MDKGQKATEKLLKQVEKRINAEYAQATEEIEAELADYLRRFEKKDERWQEWVKDGVKTAEEYQKWRLGQMAVGKRWSDMKEIVAHQIVEVNEDAKNKIKSICPEVYAENFNYSTYEIEKDAKINTSFTLYSKEAVERLVKDDPDILPPIGKKVSQEIAEGKAVKWNRQQIQSVMMQGIMQGDSIPKLATRLANKVGDSNRKAAIRNARTMATGAQNAGRVNAYKRAQDKGVDLEQMWLATLDNRTRHSHRWLDGETRPVGEAFSNGCEYPGDPKGDPAEIYNCRCTLRGVVKGLERRAYKYKDTSGMDGMTYEEWRDAKPTSNPIDLPEKKGEAIKRSYINEYRGKKGGSSSGTQSTTVNIPAPQKSESYVTLMDKLKSSNIKNNLVEKLTSKLEDSKIIERISGGDMTKGSCSSLTYAYIANKFGLDVHDFRGGSSCDFFSLRRNTDLINSISGVEKRTFYFQKEATELAKKLKELDLEKGKEYRLSCGRHAAIIRNTEHGYEYLELQSHSNSGWRSFTEKQKAIAKWDNNGIHLDITTEKCSMADTLSRRFGCRKTASNTPIIENGKLLLDENGIMVMGERVEITDISGFKNNPEFMDILGYINTDPSKQKKGASGGEK